MTSYLAGFEFTNSVLLPQLLFFNNLFVHFTFQLQSPPSFLPQSCPYKYPPTNPSSHSSQRRQNLLGHHPGKSSSSRTSHILFHWGSPGRGRGSNGRHQSQRQPPLQLLGDTHEDQTAHLLHMYKGCRSSLCMVFGWWFSLCDPPSLSFISAGIKGISPCLVWRA